MQASHSEKVKSPCLLKRFFDVFGCLMSEAEHDSAQKILHVGCILQPAAKNVLHPCPRLLRCAHDRVATAVSNERAALRVADEEQATNVPAREIGTHIEFAGISWRRDRLGSSKKFKFIAKFRDAFPTHLPDGVHGLFPAFQFN